MMFDSLPKKLRYEVSMAMYEGAAAKIPFFQGRSPEFISTIIPYLRYMYLDTGDCVYRQGDDSDELYVILRGRVTFVIGRESMVFKRMLEGAYFGDVEVILRSKRLCTCCMEYDGELLVMPKPMLKFVAIEFPEVFQEMEKLARERKQRIIEGMDEVEEALRKLQEESEIKNFKIKQNTEAHVNQRATTFIH
jgi:CRP-like cAMP-binding protein